MSFLQPFYDHAEIMNSRPTNAHAEPAPPPAPQGFWASARAAVSKRWRR